MRTRPSSWSRFLRSCLAGALFFLVSSHALADTDKENAWKYGWKNNIFLDSPGGDFKLKIGGRLFADFAAWTSEDPSVYTKPDGETEDVFTETGVEIRSARLFVSGTLYKRVGFKVQYDFASQDIKDVYLSIKKIPLAGTLKFGHFKEPFSLEELTSARFITFMERSVANAFTPKRNTGIMASNTALDQRMTWAIGGFRNSNDDDGEGFGGAGGYELTGRITGAPIYSDDGSKVLHLGVAYSHQFRKNTTDCDDSDYACIDWSTRPETHLGPKLAGTGEISSDGSNLLNLEAALVLDSLSIQSEYNSAWVKRMAGTPNDVRFWGFYAEASYFLTGEHRNYLLKTGAFGRVDVLKPLGQGWGALEVAFRYSRVNMNGGVWGPDTENYEVTGNLQDFTLGVNWYLFSNVRMMANYVHSEDKNGPPGANKYNIFQARAQIDF